MERFYNKLNEFQIFLNYKIDLDVAIAINKINFNKKEKEIKINELLIVEGFLKRRDFVKYGNIFTKGFLIIIINESKGKIDDIIIKYDIKNSKPFRINSSFITGINIAINYYERI